MPESRRNGGVEELRKWLPVLLVAGAVVSQWAVLGQQMNRMAEKQVDHEKTYGHDGMMRDFLDIRESQVQIRTNQAHLRDDVAEIKSEIRALVDRVGK